MANDQPFVKGRVDRLYERTAGRRCVIEDSHAIAGLDRPDEAPTETVSLGVLAHRERPQAPATFCGCHRRRNGNGVGSDRHPAKCVDVAVEHRQYGLPDQTGPGAVEGRLTSIDVPLGGLSRTEGERPIGADCMDAKVLCELYKVGQIGAQVDGQSGRYLIRNTIQPPVLARMNSRLCLRGGCSAAWAGLEPRPTYDGPMPEFTCQSCGAEFSLPDRVLERYPGWMPRQCRACRGDGDGATATTSSRRTVTATSNLTVAEVLERFSDGPSDGVFTDGSAVPNPGPGGWGAVYVRDNDVVEEAHGHAPDTTNNRMELTALIEGIKLVPSGTAVTVYTDSNLAARTVNEWAAGWKRNGWRKKDGKPVKNPDLVEELFEIVESRPEIEVRWIRAHDGNRWNEYADALSTAWMRDTL